MFFFFNISQTLNVSTFGYTADIYTTFNFIPHAYRHITVGQSHIYVYRITKDGHTDWALMKYGKKKKLCEIICISV
jgi:hypothetical protein